MGFIRRLAVRNYTKELTNLINVLTQANDEQISQLLVYSVWLRAIMEVEGIILPAFKANSEEFDPELCCYPIMLRDIESMIKECKKRRLNSKVLALSIWVHTLRAIIRPEMNDLAVKLWKILIKSPENFDHLLTEHKEEDIELGKPENFVNQTLKYAKAILKVLPPKQLLENSI